MSATMYCTEDGIRDSAGSLTVEMNVNGYLFLTTQSNDCDEGSSTTFTLPPTEDGIDEAHKIIDALKEWIMHNT